MPKRTGAAKKKPIAAPTKLRQLQLPRRIWYKPLTWRFAPPVPAYKPLPKGRHLVMITLRQLWEHKKLFGGIVVLYGLLTVLLVRGLAGSSDLSTLKATIDSTAQGFGGRLVSSFDSFAYLLATSGSGNVQNSGAYQYVLLLVGSLAFIWALRQTLAGRAVRIRDSFYQGMYPLVPFFLVFLILDIQLLPLALGGGLFSLVVTNGIAVHFWEKALFFVPFVLLGYWSIRMVTGTIFALYIVTLPDMTPLRAVRSARKLVYGRRLLLWRKLIFLPVVLLVAAVCIELPLILFLTPVAAWVFFALSMLALPIVHGYLYNLYREML